MFPKPLSELIAMREPITDKNPFKIVFVCLGNICRSPTAEGIFQHLAETQGVIQFFEIDSAGTAAYHIGEPAHRTSQEVANQRGVRLHSKGRQFVDADLERFDMILVMDKENQYNVMAMDPENKFHDKIYLLRDFDPSGTGDVPDPYYGGVQGFVNVFDIIRRCCELIISEIKNHIKTPV